MARRRQVDLPAVTTEWLWEHRDWHVDRLVQTLGLPNRWHVYRLYKQHGLRKPTSHKRAAMLRRPVVNVIRGPAGGCERCRLMSECAAIERHSIRLACENIIDDDDLYRYITLSLL